MLIVLSLRGDWSTTWEEGSISFHCEEEEEAEEKGEGTEVQDEKEEQEKFFTP